MSQKPYFVIRQCQRPTCRFRFPTNPEQVVGERCPSCGAMTDRVEDPYTGFVVERQGDFPNEPQVEALLDNIRSTFNVGAMFRTADGAGLRMLHLCGMTPAPDNPKVGKTALGAERAVPWIYHNNSVDAARRMKDAGMRLWALEGGPQAQPLFEPEPLKGGPILLIVGNEVSGVDPGLLNLCERVVAIPMQGEKESLNVAIAFGVTAYFLRYGLRMAGFKG